MADVVDVLVIGAGASGAVVAKRFAEAGLSVLCLEQGEWPDRRDYPGSSPDWELRSARQWSGLPQVRNRPEDYPLDLESSDLGVVNFNGVGGGTVLYSAQWPRMLPDDFRVRSVDGVAADWPLDYAELQPYYERIDRDFGVSGLGGNTRYPPGEDPPLPPMPIGRAGLRVARAHARLGWHWWPSPNAIASAPYDGRNPCVQRGTCSSGCNEGAKGSADLTHWPKVLALGGRVQTGATVRRIVVDDRGRASGAEWIDNDGNEHFQPADVVVCAANAIGTSRLLLTSTSSLHPDGLANSSGLVGRNLMLHPLASVAGLFDEAFDGWRAHAGALIQSLEFATSDPSRGFVRGATWALSTSGGPLKAVFAPDGRGRWGAEHHRHVHERFGRTASWVVIGEDLPDPNNRVELSGTLVDRAGVPAPRLSYRLSENTEQLMQWQIERAQDSLRAAGAWSVESMRHWANGHFMGTARMGTDPTTSVVDANCVAHDVPNLLIVDGSVFVTAGSANPTSTIAAVALRAAEQLLANRSGVVPPERPRTLRSFGANVERNQVANAPAVATPARGVGKHERTVLSAAADILIPASETMPSAATVLGNHAVLDRVLRARPDLLEPLVQQLALAERLMATTPDSVITDGELASLRYVVAAAYYLDPMVRRLLHYRPDDVAPVRSRDFPEYLEEGLLDHLIDATP